MSSEAKTIGSMNKTRGQLTLQILIFGTIAVVLIGGFLTWSTVIVRNSARNQRENLSFTIAEAGVEYYRWHLAHAPTDYQDGTGQPGPYTHDYRDKDGNVIGQFTLEITPPPIGSSIVTLTSTGVVTGADRPYQKSIKVRMGKPSLAKYAFLTNSFNRFGVGTEVFGPIHANGGIRFDGLAHNVVTSAATHFDDPDHGGAEEWGVHTHVNPIDPVWTSTSSLPVRPGVFMAGRQVGIPSTNFAGLTQDLAEIKADASSSGIYYATSGASGYHLVLNNATGKADIYKVNSTTTPACTNTLNESGWGSWTINGETLLASNVSFPANGLMFFEDNLWVDGQINGARLTIAAGRFPENPSTYANIIVNKDLKYTQYDGTDVISLISQNNITVGLKSNDILRIDGALVAQNGRVGRFHYTSACSPYHVRNTITTYGMIGSYRRYGFAWTDSTGYTTRNLNYDSNLLYSPPPSFPLTTDQYSLLSWEEIK